VLIVKHLLQPVKPCFYLLRLHLSSCAEQHVIKSVCAFACGIDTCMLLCCLLLKLVQYVCVVTLNGDTFRLAI